MGILAGVGSLHLCAVMALVASNAAGRPEMGEAPVINLTLEPSPRFDAPSPPSVASSAATAAVASPVRPPELRPRDKPILPDPAIPTLSITPSTLPSPSTPVIQAAEATSRQAAGPASTQASEAGATQGGGGRLLGAAAASQEDLYVARVIAWIEQNKRSPARSATGLVTVRFILDRRGGVRDLRLIHSSSSRLLDLAALDQIRTTQPFPRPGAGATWRTREFTINIEYRRR